MANLNTEDEPTTILAQLESERLVKLYENSILLHPSDNRIEKNIVELTGQFVRFDEKIVPLGNTHSLLKFQTRKCLEFIYSNKDLIERCLQNRKLVLLSPSISQYESFRKHYPELYVVAKACDHDQNRLLLDRHFKNDHPLYDLYKGKARPEKGFFREMKDLPIDAAVVISLHVEYFIPDEVLDEFLCKGNRAWFTLINLPDEVLLPLTHDCTYTNRRFGYIFAKNVNGCVFAGLDHFSNCIEKPYKHDRYSMRSWIEKYFSHTNGGRSRNLIYNLGVARVFMMTSSIISGFQPRCLIAESHNYLVTYNEQSFLISRELYNTILTQVINLHNSHEDQETVVKQIVSSVQMRTQALRLLEGIVASNKNSTEIETIIVAILAIMKDVDDKFYKLINPTMWKSVMILLNKLFKTENNVLLTRNINLEKDKILTQFNIKQSEPHAIIPILTIGITLAAYCYYRGEKKNSLHNRILNGCERIAFSLFYGENLLPISRGEPCTSDLIPMKLKQLKVGSQTRYGYLCKLEVTGTTAPFSHVDTTDLLFSYPPNETKFNGVIVSIKREKEVKFLSWVMCAEGVINCSLQENDAFIMMYNQHEIWFIPDRLVTESIKQEDFSIISFFEHGKKILIEGCVRKNNVDLVEKMKILFTNTKSFKNMDHFTSELGVYGEELEMAQHFYIEQINNAPGTTREKKDLSEIIKIPEFCKQCTKEVCICKKTGPSEENLEEQPGPENCASCLSPICTCEVSEETKFLCLACGKDNCLCTAKIVERDSLIELEKKMQESVSISNDSEVSSREAICEEEESNLQENEGVPESTKESDERMTLEKQVVTTGNKLFEENKIDPKQNSTNVKSKSFMFNGSDISLSEGFVDCSSYQIFPTKKPAFEKHYVIILNDSKAQNSQELTSLDLVKLRAVAKDLSAAFNIVYHPIHRCSVKDRFHLHAFNGKELSDFAKNYQGKNVLHLNDLIEEITNFNHIVPFEQIATRNTSAICALNALRVFVNHNKFLLAFLNTSIHPLRYFVTKRRTLTANEVVDYKKIVPDFEDPIDILTKIIELASPQITFGAIAEFTDTVVCSNCTGETINKKKEFAVLAVEETEQCICRKSNKIHRVYDFLPTSLILRSPTSKNFSFKNITIDVKTLHGVREFLMEPICCMNYQSQHWSAKDYEFVYNSNKTESDGQIDGIYCLYVHRAKKTKTFIPKNFNIVTKNGVVFEESKGKNVPKPGVKHLAVHNGIYKNLYVGLFFSKVFEKMDNLLIVGAGKNAALYELITEKFDGKKITFIDIVPPPFFEEVPNNVNFLQQSILTLDMKQYDCVLSDAADGNEESTHIQEYIHKNTVCGIIKMNNYEGNEQTLEPPYSWIDSEEKYVIKTGGRHYTWNKTTMSTEDMYARNGSPSCCMDHFRLSSVGFQLPCISNDADLPESEPNEYIFSLCRSKGYKRISSSNSRLYIVYAPPGAGKTSHIVRPFVQRFGSSRCAYFAPVGSLREEVSTWCEAYTIQSDWKNKCKNKDFIIVDEVCALGLLGVDSLMEFFPAAIFLCLGDPDQLPALFDNSGKSGKVGYTSDNDFFKHHPEATIYQCNHTFRIPRYLLSHIRRISKNPVRYTSYNYTNGYFREENSSDGLIDTIKKYAKLHPDYHIITFNNFSDNLDINKLHNWSTYHKTLGKTLEKVCVIYEPSVRSDKFLYTALTRTNRDLIVVAVRPKPSKQGKQMKTHSIWGGDYIDNTVVAPIWEECYRSLFGSTLALSSLERNPSIKHLVAHCSMLAVSGAFGLIPAILFHASYNLYELHMAGLLPKKIDSLIRILVLSIGITVQPVVFLVFLLGIFFKDNLIACTLIDDCLNFFSVGGVLRMIVRISVMVCIKILRGIDYNFSEEDCELELDPHNILLIKEKGDFSLTNAQRNMIKSSKGEKKQKQMLKRILPKEDFSTNETMLIKFFPNEITDQRKYTLKNNPKLEGFMFAHSDDYHLKVGERTGNFGPLTVNAFKNTIIVVPNRKIIVTPSKDYTYFGCYYDLNNLIYSLENLTLTFHKAILPSEYKQVNLWHNLTPLFERKFGEIKFNPLHLDAQPVLKQVYTPSKIAFGTYQPTTPYSQLSTLLHRFTMPHYGNCTLFSEKISKVFGSWSFFNEYIDEFAEYMFKEIYNDEKTEVNIEDLVILSQLQFLTKQCEKTGGAFRVDENTEFFHQDQDYISKLQHKLEEPYSQNAAEKFKGGQPVSSKNAMIGLMTSHIPRIFAFFLKNFTKGQFLFKCTDEIGEAESEEHFRLYMLDAKFYGCSDVTSMDTLHAPWTYMLFDKLFTKFCKHVLDFEAPSLMPFFMFAVETWKTSSPNLGMSAVAHFFMSSGTPWTLLLNTIIAAALAFMQYKRIIAMQAQGDDTMVALEENENSIFFNSLGKFNVLLKSKVVKTHPEFCHRIYSEVSSPIFSRLSAKFLSKFIVSTWNSKSDFIEFYKGWRLQLMPLLTKDFDLHVLNNIVYHSNLCGEDVSDEVISLAFLLRYMASLTERKAWALFKKRATVCFY